MPATFTVPDHIRQVLRDATVFIPDKPSPANLHTLKLNGQLDRKVYMDVMKVIDGAGGKWDKKKGLHTFRDDPTVWINQAIDDGKGRNIQQEFQSFYTPAHVAAKMVELARIREGVDQRVLEPSCGEGAIVRAIHRASKTAHITAYDINDVALKKCGLGALGGGMGGPKPAAEIETGYCVLKDFLEVSPPHPEKLYDVCLANPPFSGGQDARHVMHMLDFMKSGGVVVAILSANAREKTTGPYRSLLFRCDYTITYSELLPSGTFQDTAVETLLLRFEKL